MNIAKVISIIGVLAMTVALGRVCKPYNQSRMAPITHMAR